MKKKPLKDGWYETTITQVQDDNRHFDLVFTVDKGPDAWQSVLQKFRKGSARVEELFQDLLIIPVVEPDDPLYVQQLLGHRASIKVERVVDGNFIRNVIVQFDLAIGKPEYDVTKEPTEDKFYKTNVGRKLPL
jgi:hypothetical protein